MTYQIGTVNLPKSPTRISYNLPALTDTFKITGGTAVAVGLGLDVESLTVNAVLHETGLTHSDLAGSYLTPLKNYLNTEVALDFPVSFFDGTWLMTGFQHDFNVSAPDRIFLTLKFVRGSTIEIV